LSEDPSIESQRPRGLATEIGYVAGQTIFDDREVRPRFQRLRTFQRTIYRPGEIVRRDLRQPREQIPVGHSQLRRSWVVGAEVCWSRLIAGSMIFSKDAPDIMWGLGRGLERLAEEQERMPPLPDRMPDVDRRQVVRVPVDPIAPAVELQLLSVVSR
jgi:hypothetical protein